MENIINRNKKIDILRGIAIILVMVGHGVALLTQKNLMDSYIGGVFMMPYMLFICLCFL